MNLRDYLAEQLGGDTTDNRLAHQVRALRGGGVVVLASEQLAGLEHPGLPSRRALRSYDHFAICDENHVVGLKS